MVKISGTLTSNVSLSNRLMGGQGQQTGAASRPVEEVSKPAALKAQEPDMRFNGIGRRIDIRV